MPFCFPDSVATLQVQSIPQDQVENILSSYKTFYCSFMYAGQGRQIGGGTGGGGSQPPLNFGWGVEHLSTPPDFEKIY